MFLTTKLWPTDYGDTSSVHPAASLSMQRLQTDYLDLFLMHWPDVMAPADIQDYETHRKETLRSTWRSMELLLDKGCCRAIGVSNFQTQDLAILLEEASLAPHVNQCEFHPCQNPVELRKFCDDNKIQFQVLFRGFYVYVFLHFCYLTTTRLKKTYY